MARGISDPRPHTEILAGPGKYKLTSELGGRPLRQCQAGGATSAHGTWDNGDYVLPERIELYTQMQNSTLIFS